MDNRRIDLSNYLIHFTKGSDETDNSGAYRNLKSILKDQTIIANHGDIRGGFDCVCFTEAPIDCLKSSSGIVCFDGKQRYSNYGIMIPKIEIYNLGGRPAIYTDPEDYEILPDHLKHRFVRFQPLKEIGVTGSKCDFTWEREWRIKQSIYFSQLSSYEIIVPTLSIGNQLIQEASNESYLLYEDCQNNQVQVIDYENLCNDTCEVHKTECPEPIFVENNCIICMDNTC